MKLETTHPEAENGTIYDVQQQLHEYVKAKDIKNLAKLLADARETIDIDQPDWYGSGNAAIIDATIQGEIELVRILCENGCDVNARTVRGETALHVAVSRFEFDTEMINLLLSNGCNADIQDNLGRQTALHVFVRKHISATAATTITTTSAPSAVTTPTTSTTFTNEVQDVFETLAKATNVNIADRRSRTPLHCLAACRKTNIKLIQFLMECQASVNLRSDRGETPLHEALENNNEAATQVLIPSTNLYIETNYKETPLHVAARKNMHAVVPLLLKHRAPINGQDLYGNTALHLAASKGYEDVVRFLVENNEIQLNVTNKEGKTPLHLAVESGFIFTVEILAKADSCDLTARTKRSETALDLAQQDYRRKSQPEMTEVLSREIQRRSFGKMSL